MQLHSLWGTICVNHAWHMQHIPRVIKQSFIYFLNYTKAWVNSSFVLLFTACQFDQSFSRYHSEAVNKKSSMCQSGSIPYKQKTRPCTNSWQPFMLHHSKIPVKVPDNVAEKSSSASLSAGTDSNFSLGLKLYKWAWVWPWRQGGNIVSEHINVFLSKHFWRRSNFYFRWQEQSK